MGAPEFQYREFSPPEPLRPFLRRSFFAKGRIPYSHDKILPNGLVVAVYTIGGPHRLGKSEIAVENPEFAHSWLHGVQTTPVFNHPSSETHVLGLLFEPIGFHVLFGTDMRRIAERTCDAREILPANMTEVIEQSLPNAATESAHAHVHAALLRQPRRAQPDWVHALYDDIVSRRGALELSHAYETTGCSPRHVSTTFKHGVGVSPKVLCRIYRLQALLEAIDPVEHIRWTDLAHEFGFYDQAHFNREFREFSGLHPNAYLAARRRNLPDLSKGESVSFAPQD